MSVTKERVQADSLDKEFDIAADFPLPSLETWRKIAEESLKGGSYEKKLLTQTLEGIQLEPIYTADLLKGMKIEQIPGFGEFVRGARSAGHLCSPWQIAQELMTPRPADVGKMAEKVLGRGQDALLLPLHPAIRCADLEAADYSGKSIWAHSLADFTSMLAKVDLQVVPVHIDAGINGLELLAMMVALQQSKKQPVQALLGSVLSDPLSVLNQTGHLSQDLSLMFDKAASALNWAGSCCPRLRTLGVNGLLFREAGADAVLELAAMLAMGTTYIDQLVARGISVERISAGMAFTAGIGPHFFMEIAKFRAWRALWTRIVSAYGVESHSVKPWVRAQTSTYDWTRYDRHVNLLRATTETFSAIVGGVDAVTVAPFSRLDSEDDDFSRRISRNIQIILRDESHLDRVVDPAGGSYYVEWLTQQLIDKAWKLFVEIDEAGGYLEELKSGKIQALIKRSRQTRSQDLAKRKQLLVGINAYANVKEEAPGKANGETGFVCVKRVEKKQQVESKADNNRLARENLLKCIRDNSGDVIQLLAQGYADNQSIFDLHISDPGNEPLQVLPFDFSRLSEPFETLRDRTATRIQDGRGPVRVLLLTMGPAAEHKARADFSKMFMEVAGFEVVYPETLNGIDDALAKGRECKPEIAVLCSTDERYPELVAALPQPLKTALPGLTMVLAGNPRDLAEKFRQEGIDEFLFLGCDALKVLNDLFDKSEVKR